uniref:Uncharacterized protein n=1 Tax=Labrus bergylta TaxID=56723 RepID=A0A3Q3MPR9_9LABR
MRTLLLATALLSGLLGSLAAHYSAPVPYHAFCRVMWLFAKPCDEIGTKIVQQIRAFYPQYMLVSASALSVKANHTSLDGLQAENVTFTFSSAVETEGCRTGGQSISLGFTSLLDNGLNYCNLFNLLSASGLTSSPGFIEITNEWACLGFGLATCKA